MLGPQLMNCLRRIRLAFLVGVCVSFVEMCHWGGVSLEVPKAHSRPVSLSPSLLLVHQGVLLSLCLHHAGLLPTMMIIAQPSETVSKPQLECFLLKVTLVVVSLQSWYWKLGDCLTMLFFWRNVPTFEDFGLEKQLKTLSGA